MVGEEDGELDGEITPSAKDKKDKKKKKHKHKHKHKHEKHGSEKHKHKKRKKHKADREEEEEGDEEDETERKKRKFDDDIAKLEKAREVLKAVLSVDGNSNQDADVNPMDMIAQGYAATDSEEEDGEVDHEETKIEKKISREWKILEDALAEKVKQEKLQEEERQKSSSRHEKHSRHSSDRHKSKENDIPHSREKKKGRSDSPVIIDLTDDNDRDRKLSRDNDQRSDSYMREKRRSPSHRSTSRSRHSPTHDLHRSRSRDHMKSRGRDDIRSRRSRSRDRTGPRSPRRERSPRPERSPRRERSPRPDRSRYIDFLFEHIQKDDKMIQS